MPKDVEPSEFNGNVVVVGGGLKNEREGKKKTAQLAVSEREDAPTNGRETNRILRRCFISRTKSQHRQRGTKDTAFGGQIGIFGSISSHFDHGGRS